VYRTGAGAVVALDPRARVDALVPALSDRPLHRPERSSGRAMALGTLDVYGEVLAGRARTVA
jgi:hypothetical protein